MKKRRIAVTIGCVCTSILLTGVTPAMAAGNVEIDSAVAGLSVAMNNFYASSEDPEAELKDYLQSDEIVYPEDAVSPYANLAVSQVGAEEGYVNIRTGADTDAEVLGKIYNNCAATIEETITQEDGTWYKIKSGSVEGYIKADYFVTGQEAEKVAMEIGKSFGEVSEGGLKLRAKANPESAVVETLWSGDIYTVVSQGDGYVQLSLGKDDDGNEVTGYVPRQYVNTYVKFDEAISLEEEQAKLEEEARLAEEARKAEEELRRIEEEEKKEKEEESKREDTSSSSNASSSDRTETAAQAPSRQEEEEAPAPTRAPETQAPAREPETQAPARDDTVADATRSAVVAYAKQFVGCPYVYGGNSLSGGTDCSGFTRGVYSHFGIGLPRTSRSQAGAGRRVAISDLQPGDLVFYANGGSIYHVAMYIGGGQVVHAISESRGIGITSMNVGSVYCAVSLF